MIVLDANVFLRHLTSSVTEQDNAFAAHADEIFRRGLTEENVFTCNEAVIAEVVFILSDQRHYGVTRERVNDLLRPLLEMRGCGIYGKRVLLDALRYWTFYVRLSFVDTICLAQSLMTETPLMTFDARLNRVFVTS
ncbi:MAG: PIN domain-containing protein [Thermomicrobiales bacterium]